MPDAPRPPAGADERKPADRLPLQIAAAIYSRLILNTARRFPYTFAPALSRGLNVPLTAVSGIIAVNQITGFLGLFIGPLADRYGYRVMMLAGMGMLVIGLFAAGFLPFYGVVLVSLFLAGLGKSVFDPALQAYIGERVPFERRGRVIGILECCWAGSTLVGIPVVGLLIDRLGWRSPFLALGGMGLLALLLLGLLLKKKTARVKRNPGGHGSLLGAWKEIPAAWRRLAGERIALGALGFAFFISLGNDALFVVYGAWLEQSFGLSIIALGMGTGVIGAAELCGEILTAAVADRVGLVRSLTIGLALNTLSYAALPFMGCTLFWALTALFLVFLTLEFTVVCALSLCTEIVPGARATMMSTFFAAAGTGRVIGALIGGPVWLAGGILSTGLVSATSGVLALVCLAWGFGRRSRR
jgi:predicted MFS family arabinose efflux permease